GAVCDFDEGVFHHLLDARRILEVGVKRDGFAHRSAQQLIDGHAEYLRLQIPKCDVDATDQCGGRTAGADVGECTQELVPDGLDVARVLTFEKITHFAEGGDNGSVGDRAGVSGDLAPTGEAFVRVDL